MQRSVSLSLKFTNRTKRQQLDAFVDLFRQAIRWYIDQMWGNPTSKYATSDLVSRCPVNLSSRAKQAAGKQASSIIWGTIKKHNGRIYVRNRLAKLGRDTSKLDKIIEKRPSKPEIGNIPIQLDSRFFKVEQSKNSFELWVRLTNGQKQIIYVPLKKTKMYNKWAARGDLKGACLLTGGCLYLVFESQPTNNQSSGTLAVDIGINSIFATSDRRKVVECPHGHTLNSICRKLSLRKKNGKGFKRAQAHRRNFINWSIKQLNLGQYQSVAIEDLKQMRKHKRISRTISHFTYGDVLAQIERFAEELNVSVIRVNPAYTSQKCSKCGDVQARNRKGSSFKCRSCGYTDDADLNAAQNILASL